MAKNYHCDGSRCTDPNGEVRVYPLGGGANLILCRVCWAYENSYRLSRREPEKWPNQDWDKAERYG